MIIDTAAPGGEPQADPGAESDISAPHVETPRGPFREKDWGRKARRAVEIHAYIGPNGSGKSLAMVHDTLPTLAGEPWSCSNPSHRHMSPDYVHPLTGEVGPLTSGMRRVLSTVPLLDADTGLPHPLYSSLSEWSQVLEAEHCDVLFDEVTGIANSRAHQAMPVQVQTILDQLRKVDVVLRITAPAFGRMDLTIRQVCRAVTLCAGHLPARSEGVLWRQNRLFRFRTFDARDMEDFTAAKANATTRDGSYAAVAPRSQSSAFMWGPRSRAFASYDTLGSVSRVGEVLDSGRCAHCGGKRNIPTCRCGNHS